MLKSLGNVVNLANNNDFFCRAGVGSKCIYIIKKGYTILRCVFSLKSKINSPKRFFLIIQQHKS